MKRFAVYLSLVLIVLAFSSCSNGKKNVFTPTSSGRPYEVLVVVDPVVWEKPAGRALFDVLDTDVPGLPQSERSFRISYTAPRNRAFFCLKSLSLPWISLVSRSVTTILVLIRQ